MARPAVDVVVPYAGRDPWGLATRMRACLDLGDGDTLTVVDNRGRVSSGDVVADARVRTSYYARNVGAARGSAEWIVFLDADVEMRPGLLGAYFAVAPGADVGVLAGGIEDEAPDGAGSSAAVRYAAIKRSMSQETVLAHGEWAFAQTANCAVRREAFEAVGGFVEDVRSGGDADLCWRIRDAGWTLERRDAALVTHRSRRTVRALLANRFRHGTGAGWLAKRHPGALPARSKPGLAWWLAREWARAAITRDPDQRLVHFLDPVAVWAFELGRHVPNRPLHRRNRS